MKSIIVSGPPAVGKTTVALSLADEFGLRYISGGDVLKEMASEQGFETGGRDWWDREEGMQFLSQRAENPEFDKRVDAKLTEIFDAGGAVITSYTLPWLVGDGIKIWLDGSHENSSKRMKLRDGISQEEAFEVTRARYETNTKLYKKLYDFEFGPDEKVFDRIINTDNLDAGQVIALAKSAVRDLL